MSQQENVGESRTASFRDGHDRARDPGIDDDYDISYAGEVPEGSGGGNPWHGHRTVGFGDMDEEHGAKGPRYGSDENY